MTRVQLHSLLIWVAAFTASAGIAIAQTPDAAVLNQAEVRQLIIRAEPGDHARLARHFSALAERYAAESRRHAAMGEAAGGNPNRANHSAAAHCRRLADVNAQSAATLRELATHHGHMAERLPSLAPEDGDRFERGEGAPEPTNEQLAALAADTPSDHRALQEYFTERARRYTADAAEHTAMAKAYRANANRRSGDPAAHCDLLIKQAQKAPAEATAAAEAHASLASIR